MNRLCVCLRKDEQPSLKALPKNALMHRHICVILQTCDLNRGRVFVAGSVPDGHGFMIVSAGDAVCQHQRRSWDAPLITAGLWLVTLGYGSSRRGCGETSLMIIFEGDDGR